MNTYFHGTSYEIWDKIKKDGELYGERGEANRVTFLATNIAEASRYGDVILLVNYDPKLSEWENNYQNECFQFREYKPIPLKYITLLNQDVTNSIKEYVNDARKQYQFINELKNKLDHHVLGENRVTVEGVLNDGEKIWITDNQKGRDGDLNHQKLYGKIND